MHCVVQEEILLVKQTFAMTLLVVMELMILHAQEEKSATTLLVVHLAASLVLMETLNVILIK